MNNYNNKGIGSSPSSFVAATLLQWLYSIMSIALFHNSTRVAQKTSRTLRNYNGAYTLWGKISFGTFVDQYVLLFTYKFQWRH